MKTELINDIGKACPDCGFPLHISFQKEGKDINEVEYCKQCGFRIEILKGG